MGLEKKIIKIILISMVTLSAGLEYNDCISCRGVKHLQKGMIWLWY